jgi:hypothetical protein
VGKFDKQQQKQALRQQKPPQLQQPFRLEKRG